MNQKLFEQITSDDIQALIDNDVRESRSLESDPRLVPTGNRDECHEQVRSPVEMSVCHVCVTGIVKELYRKQ